LAAGIYANCLPPANRNAANAGDESSALGSLHAYADGVGLASDAIVANIDITIARREVLVGSNAQCDVKVAGTVGN